MLTHVAPTRRRRSSREVRTGAVLLATTLLAGVFAFGPAAGADDGDHSDDAKVLVLQAIAQIVNSPDDHMEIEEHIEAALEARHTEGVDMAHVRHAASAYQAGDLRRTRDYLQSAIGAGPFVSTAEPRPIRGGHGEPGQPAYAVGGEAGTLVVLDSYQPGRALNGGDLAVLLIGIGVIFAGGLLAWRYRPVDTIRHLSHVPERDGEA